MSRLPLLAAAGALALIAGASLVSPARADAVVHVPAPALDPRTAAPSETAVFAGGCFWGVQGVFQHVKGVTSAVSGYTGGRLARPDYERVSGGDTGHAESVKVTFDPRVVSYGQLLRVYFSVVADPTTLNAQGPDRGSQYRSALFPTNPAQARTAAAYLGQLGKARVWHRPIVTRIERAGAFWPAEAYHQDYLTLNPDSGYIRVNDLPKVMGLKAEFPALYRARPVLVRAKG